MFKTLTPILADTYNYSTILTPDLPGHGTSKSSGPFTFAKARSHLHDLIQPLKNSHPNRKVSIVGISLGGQVVLDFLSHYPEDADAALISGVTIAPPDNVAGWEMPHMPPAESEWMPLIMEDVWITGMEEAQKIQELSLAFTFEAKHAIKDGRLLPPTLVVRGEHDITMAVRDHETLVERVKASCKEGSRGAVMRRAWHNHPIDLPDVFAKWIDDWNAEIL
ncbi:MAG: hypothetical protein M1820_009822 [Bogoriella megaspora]|nr:MAG: hypothetical protein M1820_009822 [Bogoriella megaspora]